MPSDIALPDDFDAAIDAVIFDMDGVLIDSEPIHAEAKRQVFADFGIDVPERIYDDFKGQTDEQVLRHVAEHHAENGADVDALIEAKREAFWTLLGDRRVPMDGAEAFVEAAAHRHRVALCTSASPTTRELAFDPLGWSEHFEAFVTAADVEHPKPDPEPYRLAAERIGVAPERCLVVEDSLSGVRSARAAGCYVAALTTSMPRADLEDAGAHLVADTFGALTTRLGWDEAA